MGLRKKQTLLLFTYSGLTLKCVINGNLPNPESKDTEPERFEEKTVDCESDMCSTNYIAGSDEALLTCGPNKSDEPEFVNKCKEKDGNKFCFCDTELCKANQGEQSPAIQFVSNWIFISLGIFALMQI